MIVLNEVLYAEEWLEKDVPWKKAGHVLHYVAKYYFYKGYSKDDVREKLNEYMLRHFEGYNKVLDRELIDKAIASAKGRPMVELDGVCITKAEVEKIQALEGKQMQRLMFTMLCLAKYHIAVNEKCNYWITISIHALREEGDSKNGEKHLRFCFIIKRSAQIWKSFSKNIQKNSCDLHRTA